MRFPGSVGRTTSLVVLLKGTVLLLAVVLALLPSFSCRSHVEESDLVLLNGTVYTVDPDFRVVQALAIREGRIQAVGDNENIRQAVGPNTEQVNLAGMTVVPGFGDGHTHVLNRAEDVNHVVLTGMGSIADIQNAIRRRAEAVPPGTWIIGTRGWWEYELVERRYPTRWELDEVSPEHPVAIRGPHYWIANSRALELAGVDRTTPSPPGGEINLDPKRAEPDGLLLDAASFLVRDLIPKDLVSGQQVARGFRTLAEELLSQGITLLRDPGGIGLEGVSRYRELVERYEIPLRIDLLYWLDGSRELEEIFQTEQTFPRPAELKPEQVRVIGIKLAVDGGGEYGGFMREPYRNRPGDHGLLRIEPEKLATICSYLNERGWSVALHTVGDAAIDIALDAIEAAARQQPVAEQRWGLEHVYLTRPEHFERARALELVIHSQYINNYSLAPLLLNAWGDQAHLSTPLKSWMEAGVVVSGGMLTPIAYPTDPLLTIYGAVTRQTAAGVRLGPEEALSRRQALEMMTRNVAYASFRENETGSIEVGKSADLVILSDNLMKVPEEKIPDLEVLATLFEGRVVYQREGVHLFTSRFTEKESEK